VTQLKLMGGLTLDPAGFTQPKPLLLLAYLALEGAQQRRRLAELFWPDGNRMKSLSMTLTRLRQGAGDVIEADERRAWSTSPSDAGELLTALGSGAWERAAELYRGAFLDGVNLVDWGSELEEWVHATREYLAERVQHGLLELAEAAAGRQDFAAAAELAERAWRLPGAGPAEPAALRRIYGLLAAGRNLRAPEARHELHEYGVEIGLSTEAARALWPRTRTRADASPGGTTGADATPAVELAPTSAAPAPTNLRSPRTSFVGRHDELRRIEAALADRDGRLLTVVGPGGIGKSRLAHEAAGRLLHAGRYPDGVYVVGLDSGADMASLPWRMLDAIGAPADPRAEPWTQAAAALGPSRTLLVLDDADGAGEIAPQLAALLEAAPRLDLLLTARERLGLAEEQAVALSGLEVPPAGTPWTVAAAGGAVRLVIERARQLRADLDLEPQLPGLIELCRVLEGSPLALELVAPWTRLVPCAEIVAQVTGDPGRLAATTTELPERHRSLRAVFETSWSFLGATERSVARRLAVFAGGFRREAAAAVARASLATMARLVDAALLRGTRDGRYTLHPLVVTFLREKLVEAPRERAVAEARHRSFYLAWLAEQRDLIERGQQQRVFAALHAERANVDAIVRRAVAVRDLDALESVLGFVDVTYEARGALAEGRRLLEGAEALLRDDPAAASLRARTLIDLGWFHQRLGAIEEGQARTREGLELLGPDGSVTLSARGTMNLALAEGVLGHRERAEPLLQRALELALASGDEGLTASVLGSLGIHESESGRHERAAAHFSEAVALHERGGRVLSEIRETGNLAIAYGILGDLPRSGALMERSLALAREIGFSQSLPFTLSNLGVHHARLGDHARARDLNLEAKSVAEATGQLPILVGILVNLTEAHAALGDLEAAVAASDDALDLARDLGLVPLQLQALEARAELEAHRGNHAAAAALVQVVLADPAVRSYTSGSARALWERLAPGLTPADVEAASAFGRDVDVAEAIAGARDCGWLTGG
jgi:predicted ATPase/DNA-binding SARP family transcriptional activator